MDKTETGILNSELDWEYMDDFFGTNPDLEKEGNHLKTLEEYAGEDLTGTQPEKKADGELAKIIEDVRAVKAATVEGMTVKEIGTKLNLKEEYITNILFTVQGYPEDNDFAVAQLVQLG